MYNKQKLTASTWFGLGLKGADRGWSYALPPQRKSLNWGGSVDDACKHCTILALRMRSYPATSQDTPPTITTYQCYQFPDFSISGPVSVSI